jgi:hypothetical protein
MSNKYRIVSAIEDMKTAQSGVFSLSDLRNLLGIKSKDSFYRTVRGLCAAGVISRFSRGFYVTEEFSPAVLSQRICPESYISFGTVLADNLLIGSVPEYRIRAVKPKPTRIYTDGKHTIEHLGIKPDLIFGWTVDKGIRRADPEKAVLDTLYFYRLGTKFSFDIYSDVDYSSLNSDKIDEYLTKYRNPLFIDFARRLTNA